MFAYFIMRQFVYLGEMIEKTFVWQKSPIFRREKFL